MKFIIKFPWSCFIMLTAVLSVNLLFFAVYCLDNKYNSSAPICESGSLSLSLSLSLADGTATYGILIDTPTPLHMEQSAIYSASHVWVNGTLVVENGSTNPNVHFIQTILIPLLALRMLFYGLLCILFITHIFTYNLQKEIHGKTRHMHLLLQERKNFISSIAHDLKAPISIIQTYISFIRSSDAMLDKETIKYLNIIENKALQMQGQIQELQAFNQESTECESTVSIDLNEFLQQVYEDTKPYAIAGGIYFHLIIPKHSVSLFCQPSRLSRTMENIILNATNYTPTNGAITLSASYSKSQAVITVKDNGQGIAPEHLNNVFDYRFSTENTPHDIMGGTRGLGLYFAQLTISELGGKITVSSTLGEGAAFFIVLPLYNLYNQ